MPNPIENKRILLGVTGSIACYKAADLASKLRQAGAEVDIILTRSAQHFLTPLTFQSVTGRRAYTDDDLWGDAGHVLHIGLAEAADLFVIAPITANTIARLAQGLADNLLTLAALATRCPLLIAPAMDGGMYEHPATQSNLEALQERGITILGPATGHLASGLRAVGRMLEPTDLIGQVRLALSQGGPLGGRRLVVTAGGTHEAIDPVRVLTNRSSGKQGFALVQAALDLGAEVTLITAPTHLETPSGAERVDVRSAAEMLEAVLASVKGVDALVMAAAVTDFRPAKQARDKIKKEIRVPRIELERTTDILRSVADLKSEGKYTGLTIGFAAESQDLLENARAKLESKNLDLIVANDISATDAGFQVDTNRVTLLYRDGHTEPLPLMGKTEVAEIVLGKIMDLLDPQDTREIR